MGLQSRAPALVVWLLSRVGGRGSSSESLAGDIVEEYRRGRSASWLWTQVLAAIAIGGWQEIRTHKLVAMSGVITGFASLWCFAVLATLLLTSAGFPHAEHWHLPHRLVLLAVGFTYTVVSSWIVGRVHRTNRPAAVFSFLASVLIVPVLELPLLYWLAPAVFFVTVVPLLPLTLITTVIGAPVAILMGGFWDPPRRQSPHSAR